MKRALDIQIFLEKRNGFEVHDLSSKCRIYVRGPVRNQTASNAVKIIVLKRQFKASVEM